MYYPFILVLFTLCLEFATRSDIFFSHFVELPAKKHPLFGRLNVCVAETGELDLNKDRQRSLKNLVHV